LLDGLSILIQEEFIDFRLEAIDPFTDEDHPSRPLND